MEKTRNILENKKPDIELRMELKLDHTNDEDKQHLIVKMMMRMLIVKNHFEVELQNNQKDIFDELNSKYKKMKMKKMNKILLL